MKYSRPLTATFLVLLALPAFDSNAQDAPPAQTAPGTTPQVTVVQVPAQQQTPQVIVPGYPQPGYKIDGHLPSSSRSTNDTSRSADGFDFDPDADTGETARGNENSGYVIEGQIVPELHTVRSGDTL
ncbi:MAG TPA: LysM peptidoglycan-binding domain-containing protein, partial [Polyangium sp.]|nr:LysM peptidoglycan-binding domain-containing protein [Polyangium sp.]